MKGRSASSWLGCGCALLITVFMLGVLAVTLLSYRAGESLERQAAQPGLAAERVRELLPYDELPPGYVPVGATSVPLLSDMAFLRGEEAIGEGTAGIRRGFLYARFRDLFGRGDRTRAMLAGRESDAEPLDTEEMLFEPSETVARGLFDLGPAEVTWIGRRGRLTVRGGRFGARVEAGGEDVAATDAGEAAPAVLTLADLDCGDRYQRIAVWFAPDPAPDAPAGEVDWTGTPADEAALRTFLGHFRPCE